MTHLFQIYLWHGTTCTGPLNTIFSGYAHHTYMCLAATAIYAWSAMCPIEKTDAWHGSPGLYQCTYPLAQSKRRIRTGFWVETSTAWNIYCKICLTETAALECYQLDREIWVLCLLAMYYERGKSTLLHMERHECNINVQDEKFESNDFCHI